jgi:lipopolysaccharide transport system ATP-binding protein
LIRFLVKLLRRCTSAQDFGEVAALLNVGIFGTFDVENFGDLLFPLLAQRELTERLGDVAIRPYSYHDKSSYHWPYDVTSLEKLPEHIKHLDAVLIGGGFLIRFDKEVAPGYGPPNANIHHPLGYWLVPALMAAAQGIPLIWNAPGMHCNEIPPWAKPMLKLALRASSYIAVRDEPSQLALTQAIESVEIKVVPDTAFAISRTVGEPTFKLRQLLTDHNVKEPFIIIQAALGLEYVAEFIKGNSKALERYTFVALPIGPVLGDSPDILIVQDIPATVSFETWLDPLLMAELIGRADAVIGYSYHLCITAMAYGVPAFSAYDLSVGKYTALQKFPGVHQISRDVPISIEWFLQRLGRAAPSLEVGLAGENISRHWDIVADKIKLGRTRPVRIAADCQALPFRAERGKFRLRSALNKVIQLWR